MKVFISYSKEDYKFAKRIYDNLSRQRRPSSGSESEKYDPPGD